MLEFERGRPPDNIAGWDRQTLPPKGSPHAWIQWKGTEVCMDVYCGCGAAFHVDGWFAYYVECPGCSQVHMCNGHIELVPLLPGEEPPNRDVVLTGEDDPRGEPERAR